MDMSAFSRFQIARIDGCSPCDPDMRSSAVSGFGGKRFSFSIRMMSFLFDSG
jgi:hypothetical protein